MEPKLIRRSGRAVFEKRASFDASEEDLKLVQRWMPEGVTLGPDEIYVASALVCNDLVDHYSTQFTDRALTQIAELIPGVNVMRNHNEYSSDDLPIARAFAAERVKLPDGNYVRSRFYWERGTACGDEMAKKIRLGIWRETSLSWWMRSFTNSIDGEPFDESPYYPGQEFEGVTVIGIMDDVVEVNEWSIVARGGQKNTSMSPTRDGYGGADVLALVAAARSRNLRESGFTKFFQKESRNR